MPPLSRRDLFLSAAVAGVARFPTLLAAAADSSTFTLGFSLYGMNSLSWEEALEACAKIGYRDVEPALMPQYRGEPTSLSPQRRREIRRRLEELGLAVPALMENLVAATSDDVHRTNRERLVRAAELGRDLGCRRPVVETVLGGKPAEWEKLRQAMVDRLGDWAATARQHEMVVAVKPHVGGALHTPDDALWLVEQIASPNLRLVYDYSHYQLRGYELADSLEKLIAHTAFIHVKDGRGTAEKFQFLLPGEGSTDYATYFRLLRKHGYAGSVMVEVSGMIHGKPGYDPIAAARKSYAALTEGISDS